MDRKGYLMIIVLFAIWTRIEGAGYCSPGSQVIKSCTDGSVTGSRLFLDVGGKTSTEQSCRCQLTTSVTQIIANLVEAPGYDGCGIKTQLSGSSIITYNCKNGGTFIDTSSTRTISITANKSVVNYEIPYCLMLQIPQGVSGVLSLSCKSKSTSTSLFPTSTTMTVVSATTKLAAESSTILSSSPSTQTVPHTVQTRTESSGISTMPISEDTTSAFWMSTTSMSSTISPTSLLQVDTTYSTSHLTTRITHQYNTLTTVTMSTKTDIQQSEITPTSTQPLLSESVVKISSSTTQHDDTTSVISSMTNHQSTNVASATPPVTSPLAATITSTSTESIFLSSSDSDSVNSVTYTDNEKPTSRIMMQTTSTVDVMISSVELAASSQTVQTDSTDNQISVTTESTPGNSRKNDGIIAVAVIGTLVGVGLIIFLIGAIYYKNRQRRRGLYSREKSAYLNYAANIDEEGVVTSANGNTGNSYSSSETPQIVPYDDQKSL